MKSKNKSRMNKIVLLALSVLVPLVAGFVGSAFTLQSLPTWYAGLVKPPFNPPNWLFGPVWTTLYIAMGVSLFLVVTTEKKSKNINHALSLFFTQLVFNALWSILFFGMKNPELAFTEIVFLWSLIYLTITNFLRINKTAGLLLIPYLTWVSFATILNLSIAILN